MSDHVKAVLNGPWKVHFDVPTAAFPGHIIKMDDLAELPICNVPKGGGSNGGETFRAVARQIAAAPRLYRSLFETLFCFVEVLRQTRVNPEEAMVTIKYRSSGETKRVVSLAEIMSDALDQLQLARGPEHADQMRDGKEGE